MKSNFRYQEAKRVTLISVGINLLLSLLKIIFGIVGYSQALFADGIHSLSDLVTDLMVLFASKAGSQAPDQSHPYGHGRVETIFTLILSIVLILVGGGIIYDAIYEGILHGGLIHPAWWTLVIAAISVIANEFLYRVTKRVGDNIHSNILVTNAWHHRCDAFSSLVVLIGIGGASVGIRYLDAIAAIIVAIMILHVGVKFAWSCLKELMDVGVSNTMLDLIRKEILAVSGVNSVHQLRTRLLGGVIFLDLHVQVDPNLTVSEGHYIGEQVPKRLVEKFSKVADVTVHVDPEDDENVMLSAELPNRQEIIKTLGQLCEDLAGYNLIKKINLHYLAGKISVELFFSLTVLNHCSQVELTKQYVEKIQTLSFVASVQIYFI